ncbi:hypothetical protein RB599_009621 [Gaeumannomyces hyphopodioides]
MEQNLTYLFEPDESPNSMEIEPADAPQHHDVSIESLEAISGAIDRLSHLGIAIRQSSVRGQANKTRAYQQTFDFSSFEGVAYLALKTLYADASEELVEQLTRSMTETYRLFLHRKHRQQTLQAPRERPRTPSGGLCVIAEEPGRADGTLAGSPMNVEMPATPQESRKSATASPRGPPPVRQHRLPVASEKPSSVDSQEVKKKFNKMLSPSIKGKAKSILVSNVDYPQPPKGSLKCQWCFSSLSADILEKTKWQHVNEDHKPYVCISEKCSQPPRFAASSQWFQHMLTSHGRDWHREVHAPSSWVCPLCFDGEVTFSKPTELADHFGAFHNGIFTDSQVRDIVQQSRVRSTRPGDTCPLCCRSMEQRNPLTKEKGKARRGSSSKQPFQGDPGLEGSFKRIKTEAGHSQPDQHGDGDPGTTAAAQHKPNAQADPSAGPLLNIEAIASHIAGHLRSIMLLTQRMIETDVAMDISADNKSVSGGTDDDHEFHVMSERDDGDDDTESAPDFGSDKSMRSEAGGEGEGRGEEGEDETVTDDGADWSRIPNKDPAVDPANDPLKNLREAQTRKAARLGEQEGGYRSRPGMRSVDLYSQEFRFYICLLQWKYPRLSHKLATRIAATMQVREDRLRLLQADVLMARRREHEKRDREIRVPNPGRHLSRHLPQLFGTTMFDTTMKLFREMPSSLEPRGRTPSVRSELSVWEMYPDPPERQDAVCPYCARVCTSKMRRNWRRHVDVDIKPWVCISDECTEPFVYFSTFAEWHIHMEERHSVTWYRILLKGGDFAEDKLPQLVDGPFICPLCEYAVTVREDDDVHVRAQIAGHVGRHLKSLAFFCLRNLDQGSDDCSLVSNIPSYQRRVSSRSLSVGTSLDFEKGAEPLAQGLRSNEYMEYYEGIDNQEQEPYLENADAENWAFLKSVVEDDDALPIRASSPRRRIAEDQRFTR